METKVEEQATFVDTVKLALTALIVLAGLFSYYYFASSAVLLRAFGVIVALGAAIGVLFTSFQGRLLWTFIQWSRPFCANGMMCSRVRSSSWKWPPQ